ncbi:hypothetical protein ACFSQD_01650 [Flavihumibacter stibioxidans]|uniref:Death domain-containing protein n=1 Tax=Flavihumibacter stibioxidans TaxID=1834163 RepID=A0ABR7MB49_9BACT|nr:hypothetical protein [Flavihumibacter stibioxidans]MBC6492187.1 hypothetical protein [Flavihumibacter stibioxidans]
MEYNLVTITHKRRCTFKLFWLYILLAAGLYSCALTAPYDQFVYKESTSLKVDALKLMDKAAKPFESQQEAVEKLNDQLDKLYEYELHRRKNGIRISMWNLLRDPEKNLLGGFLKRWKEKSTLGEPFIDEARIQIGKAFDQLAELESGKITPKELQQ